MQKSVNDRHILHLNILKSNQIHTGKIKNKDTNVLKTLKSYHSMKDLNFYLDILLMKMEKSVVRLWLSPFGGELKDRSLDNKK